MPAQPPLLVIAGATATGKTGLAIDVVREGDGRPLAATTDQAAYRILQEALTNAARHGAGRTEVKVRYGKEELDGRSDLFALGCIFVEALTGKQPFEVGHDVLVLHAIRSVSPEFLE